MPPLLPALRVAALRRRLEGAPLPMAAPALAEALALALFLAALCLGLWRAATTAINLDVGFFLLGARTLRDGRELYVTWFDFNTPANYALPWLSLWLAEATGLRPADTTMAMITALLLGCAVLAALALRRAIPQAWSLPRIIGPAAFVLCLLVRPGFNFGQREVVFLAGLLPLLVLLWARRSGRAMPGGALAVTAALLAAFGAAHKPHFVVFLAGLAAMDLVLARLRPGHLAWPVWLALALAVAEMARMLLVHPQYLPLLLDFVGPGYAALGSPWRLAQGYLLGREWLAAALLGGLLAAHAWARPSPGQWPTMALWAGCLTLALGMFLAQGIGLLYQRFVYEALVVLTGVLALAAAAELACRLVAPRRLWPRAAAALGLVVLFAWHGWTRPGVQLTRAMVVDNPVVAMLEALPPGAGAMALQTMVNPASVLHGYARGRFRWAAEFGALTEFAAIERERQRARQAGEPMRPALAAIERAMLDRVVRAFADDPPALVLVEHPRIRLQWHGTAPALPIIAVLAADPRFAAAWAGYGAAESVAVPEGISARTELLDIHRRHTP